MDTETRCWLAGLLEGEGSFMKGNPVSPGLPIISIQMTDEDVIKKVSDIFEVSYHQVCEKRRIEHPHWKTCFGARVRGSKAVAIMKEIRYLMGTRRQGQIDKALASYEIKQERFADGDIEAIIELCRKGEMTQGEIAKKFGTQRETVNKIWRGKYKPLLKLERVPKGEATA